MTTLDSIPLAKFRTQQSWRTAKLGALLQVADTDGAVVIGMRCEMKISGIPHPCLLVVDGDNRGSLLEAGAIHEPAVDVSEVFELAVSGLCPTPYSEALHDRFGIVCETMAGSGHLLIRAKNAGSLRAYVWIKDPSQSTPRGTVITEFPPDLTVWGQSTLVRKTPAQN